ncbi:hypothetical protein JCM8097_002736 [Rhodosporidiobolus ruineniae]
MRFAAFFGLVSTLVAVVRAQDSLPVNGLPSRDPSLAKGPDGTYLLAVSKDRENWQSIGPAFPSGAPASTSPFLAAPNDELWAPDVTWVEGRREYVMYYSASTIGSQNSGIFLATSPSGAAGTWTDHGLIFSTKPGDPGNAIDPHLIIKPNGEWWLSWGSYFQGLYLSQLDPATGKLTGAEDVHIAQRFENGGSEEASWVLPWNGEWYLFTSFDKCCLGLSSTYNVRVAKSSGLLGPYVDKNGTSALQGGGTEIFATHGAIIGPGGQSLLVDDDGVVLVYHYYKPDGPYLGVNLVSFDGDWPTVY